MRPEVEKRVNELYKKHKIITPDLIIDDAKNPKSPLHSEFEWDVNKAALSAWRETARRIIRSVTIEITIESHSIAVPRYVHSPQENGGQNYSDIANIKSDYEKASDVMQYEIMRMKSIIDRVKRISLALNIESEIKSLSKIIDKIEKKIH